MTSADRLWQRPHSPTYIPKYVRILGARIPASVAAKQGSRRGLDIILTNAYDPWHRVQRSGENAPRNIQAHCQNSKLLPSANTRPRTPYGGTEAPAASGGPGKGPGSWRVPRERMPIRESEQSLLRPAAKAGHGPAQGRSQLITCKTEKPTAVTLELSVL